MVAINNNQSVKSKSLSLYFQVIIAIICGVTIGHFYPKFGEALKPLGDGFVKLVKMIIAPVIFLTIATGIARMRDLRGFGAVTIKAFAYFFFFSTLALLVGIFVANVIHPGVGMNIDPKTLDASKIAEYTQKAHDYKLTSFLLDIIPNTFISAFTEGNILQVLFVSILFGVGLVLIGEKSEPIINILESFSHVVFKVVDILMKAAPIGAFGAMAFTIGKYGIKSLVQLASLVGTFYLTSALFIIVVLGVAARISGFNIFRLIAYIKTEILLVLGTSSSESALPKLMEKLEKAGCKREIVGLVVPTGYSFNLDGTNIYMTLAALFIAQAMNIHLTLQEQFMLFAVAILSSKGAAGVTGAGFITLAATLSIVPSVPVTGIAIIFGVDRFMSECRAITNFIGNAVATIIISKWNKGLDMNKLDAAFAGYSTSKTEDVVAVKSASGVNIGEADPD